MEIKIYQHSGKTSIYEGNDFVYESFHYMNRDDFQKKYNECTKGVTLGRVVGIPKTFWENSDPDIEGGYFIFIIYENDKYGTSFIVVKDAIVYITNKGQTIDKIDC
jgi:hypothetical protein